MNHLVFTTVLSLSVVCCPVVARAGAAAERSKTPPFSPDRLMQTVRFLASEESQGRGFGSPGLERAAAYIAEQFKLAGLKPAGDRGGSYFQAWEDRGGDPERAVTLKNVLGAIPGKKPELAGQSIVIGAHYDHLGLGWPDVRKENSGKAHPGADDNASGVAVLIELARVLARDLHPDRSVVFIAFAGEEAGKRGSKYYVQNEKVYSVSKCIGMINLDTVGRLGKKKLLILGAGSAREWVHIFRGAGLVAGVEVDAVSDGLDSSDQKSFEEAGVPAIQLFTGPHPDYHRPTDTPDTIDAEGLVKVASVAKEVITYLADREGPLTATGRPGERTGTGPKRERKISLGTIPDFGYKGEGVRLSGVVPGSPAQRAGLREGDVIIMLNGTPVSSLRDLSDFLKMVKPGDKITIVYVREGTELKAEAGAEER